MKYYLTTTYSVTNAEVNVNDNMFINLSMKSQVKPASVQNRILRRILEKRQAQAKHRMNKVIVPKDLEPLKGEKTWMITRKFIILHRESKTISLTLKN